MEAKNGYKAGKHRNCRQSESALSMCLTPRGKILGAG
jgi:hypothetical protein